VDHSKFESLERRPALRQPVLRVKDILISDREPPARFDELLKGINRCIADKAH